jgi:hypothetical protein
MTKQIEDLNKQINELLEENKKLLADPARNKEALEAKLRDLTVQLKEETGKNEALQRDLAKAQKDSQDYMADRKRRYEERKAKKDERMKKLLEDAKKKLEENKKKQVERMAIAASADEAQSVKAVKEDLKYVDIVLEKAKETQKEGVQSEVHMVLEEPMPEFNVGEVPKVDIEGMREGISGGSMYERSSRPPGYGGGGGRTTYSYERKEGFRNGEPTQEERAPRTKIALPKYSSKYPDFEEMESAIAEHPGCPFTHYVVEEQKGKEEIVVITDFDLRRIITGSSDRNTLLRPKRSIPTSCTYTSLVKK